MKYKAYFIIFKELSLKQVKNLFWESENWTWNEDEFNLGVSTLFSKLWKSSSVVRYKLIFRLELISVQAGNQQLLRAGEFLLELEHFNKYYIYNTRKESPTGKSSDFFYLESLKNSILHEELNL